MVVFTCLIAAAASSDTSAAALIVAFVVLGHVLVPVIYRGCGSRFGSQRCFHQVVTVLVVLALVC